MFHDDSKTTNINFHFSEFQKENKFIYTKKKFLPKFYGVLMTDFKLL